ncbi:hypothetical protein [Nocardia sp. NPDC049149]|uniref:hypothetical protein n=1 Tax=Nocardia sp. NPDC049149 TaxID=3364315 RepID=UPI00371FF1DF
MPDEYDVVRKNLTPYERGLYFELGRAHEMGETPDRGWVKQFRIQTPKGPRILDNAVTAGRAIESVERKSGRVNERESREQIGKEHAAIDAGQIAKSRWETVVGEKVPEKTRELMRDTARATKGKFQHVEISREAAARAITIGQSLASEQLELIRPHELIRADRARERLENVRRIERAKQKAQTFRKAQEFTKAAVRARADAHEQAARAKSAPAPVPETVREKVARESAERAARDFPTASELFKSQDAAAADHAAREAADEAAQHREAEIREAAARTQAEQDKARDAAYRLREEQGRLTENEKLLWLGQAQHPSAAVRQAPGHTPQVERGGTGQGQGRDRGISPER